MGQRRAIAAIAAIITMIGVMEHDVGGCSDRVWAIIQVHKVGTATYVATHTYTTHRWKKPKRRQQRSCAAFGILNW